MITSAYVVTNKPELKHPPLYKVIFFDDDNTTMKCVIDLLVNFFNKNEDEAYEIMIDVHMIGKAIVGIYTKDMAETKVSLANAELKINGYPLNIQLVESI